MKCHKLNMIQVDTCIMMSNVTNIAFSRNNHCQNVRKITLQTCTTEMSERTIWHHSPLFLEFKSLRIIPLIWELSNLWARVLYYQFYKTVSFIFSFSYPQTSTAKETSLVLADFLYQIWVSRGFRNFNFPKAVRDLMYEIALCKEFRASNVWD